jgi:uncharacterized membrane protein YgcG
MMIPPVILLVSYALVTSTAAFTERAKECPLLRDHNVPEAVSQGVDAILAAARGEHYQGTGTTVAATGDDHLEAWTIGITLFLGLLGIVLLLAIRSFIRSLRRHEAGGGPVSISFDLLSGTISLSSGSTVASSGQSIDSSSSSSETFSGGGGDSGGGGASDSW